MKRHAKQLALLAAVAAVSLQAATGASACDRSGRRGRIAAPVYSGYARAASNYRTTLPSTTPVYTQPAYSSHPTAVVRRAMPQTGVQRSTPSAAAVQPRPRNQVAAQAATNQPAENHPVTTARPTANAPARTTPSAAAAQPASQPTTNTAANAESSALAALASIAAQTETTSAGTATDADTRPTTNAEAATRQTAPAAGPKTTGAFRAMLPSKLAVELVLSESGTFSWTVSGKEKTTNFSGQYRIDDGRLTLVRGNDLQQMAGTMKATGDGFTFTLDGSNNGGLEFRKS